MKRQVILFFQIPNTTEHSEIIPFTPFTLAQHGVLTKPILSFLRDQVKEAWKSKHIFKKSKTPAEVASFLQSLRDLLPVELFFALKTNGTIWNVDSCDSEKILESLRLVE